MGASQWDRNVSCCRAQGTALLNSSRRLEDKPTFLMPWMVPCVKTDRPWTVLWEGQSCKAGHPPDTHPGLAPFKTQLVVFEYYNEDNNKTQAAHRCELQGRCAWGLLSPQRQMKAGLTACGRL